MEANHLLPLFHVGTLDNPIVVNSAGDEQFAGCTGFPADSHVTLWLAVRPPKYPPSPYLPSNLILKTDVPRPPHQPLRRMRFRLPHGIHRAS